MRQIDQDLFDASKIGDLEKAKRAIENGANVNVKNEYGWTPLHLASFWIMMVQTCRRECQKE
jgi:ankyrin repeat protein